MKPLPEQSELIHRLDYDANTGKLCWKMRPDNASFSARYAGKEAFTCIDRDGYRQGKFGNICYQAHRIIFKLVYGSDPALIDHINGNPSDNRIANLRLATSAQNLANTSVRQNNKLRIKGVDYRNGRFRAQIRILGKKHHLGSFDTPEEASAAYAMASKNHFGDFYRDLRRARAASSNREGGEE